MHLRGFLGLGLAVALMSTGCAPTVERSRSAPVASAAFASEEEALAAATEAYARLLAVGDAIGQEGGVGLERLDDVAAGTFLQASRDGFTELNELGWRQVGTTQFRNMELQQIGSGPDEVLITYVCDDISGVDVVDEHGVSVVADGRPDTNYFQVTFDQDVAGLRISSRVRWDEREC